MKYGIALVAAATLAGCGTPDGGASRAELPARYEQGRCFRASEVTNYSVKAPHAAFVLTSRGFVYGLVAENCFSDDGNTVSLTRSGLADVWLCAGDTAEVRVAEWKGRGYTCVAQVTTPIYDAEVSGFRSRVSPPAGG